MTAVSLNALTCKMGVSTAVKMRPVRQNSTLVEYVLKLVRPKVSLVSAGHLCDLPAGFAMSDNWVTLFYIMKKDVAELQLTLT